MRDAGVALVEPDRGGVRFGETLADGYLACLWSRIASRVLLPLASFDAPDADALYDGVRAVAWPDHIGVNQTLAVDVAGKNAPAGPGHFLALKTKDAIVDAIRDHAGARPSVDTAHPDVRVNLHVAASKVTVNIDLSGRGLHRRGIERAGAEAPLKENLAAALLRLAGWAGQPPETPLFDPMCGSGTLLIEAAWMALDVAPGAERAVPGDGGWKGHDVELWRRLQRDAVERTRSAAARTLRIAGCDASATAVSAARDNLRRAGLTDRVRIDRRELRDVEPPWTDPGVLMTNPPYGERLGDSSELGPLYALLGDVLKRRFAGWRAWVFTGNLRLGKQIGLRPASKQVLYNGPIESRLLELPIADTPVAGDSGPGWRRASGESKALVTRLRKNLARLRPWAARERVTCYRVYDADVPEYNIAVDWYDGAVRVEEYARPRKVSAGDAERRLRDALLVVPEMLDVPPEAVVLRVRQRQTTGRQHYRRDEGGHTRVVQEGDLRFEVNLEDYLDTGLFLDDRLLRRRIGADAKGRDVLNLFAYTCTASVAAAAGSARATTSIDLSNPYLAWGRRNFQLNQIDPGSHRFIRADVLDWLPRQRGGRYDLIFLGPPTHSRSKAMRAELDLQRDHGQLIRGASALLAPGGELLFTTNLRSFILDPTLASQFRVREITAEVTPKDFERRPRLRAWSFRQTRSRQTR